MQTDNPITLVKIIAEHQRRLKAGDFDKAKSLAKKFAYRDTGISDEDLRAEIHSAWCKDKDDASTAK